MGHVEHVREGWQFLRDIFAKSGRVVQNECPGSLPRFLLSASSFNGQGQRRASQSAPRATYNIPVACRAVQSSGLNPQAFQNPCFAQCPAMRFCSERLIVEISGGWEALSFSLCLSVCPSVCPSAPRTPTLLSLPIPLLSTLHPSSLFGSSSLFLDGIYIYIYMQGRSE